MKKLIIYGLLIINSASAFACGGSGIRVDLNDDSYLDSAGLHSPKSDPNDANSVKYQDVADRCRNKPKRFQDCQEFYDIIDSQGKITHQIYIQPDNKYFSQISILVYPFDGKSRDPKGLKRYSIQLGTRGGCGLQEEQKTEQAQ